MKSLGIFGSQVQCRLIMSQIIFICYYPPKPVLFTKLHTQLEHYDIYCPVGSFDLATQKTTLFVIVTFSTQSCRVESFCDPNQEFKIASCYTCTVRVNRKCSRNYLQHTSNFHFQMLEIILYSLFWRKCLRPSHIPKTEH